MLLKKKLRLETMLSSGRCRRQATRTYTNWDTNKDSRLPQKRGPVSAGKTGKQTMRTSNSLKIRWDLSLSCADKFKCIF